VPHVAKNSCSIAFYFEPDDPEQRIVRVTAIVTNRKDEIIDSYEARGKSGWKGAPKAIQKLAEKHKAAVSICDGPVPLMEGTAYYQTESSKMALN